MTGEFTGKVVVITGATGGVGSVVTRRFAEEGATLALWERNIEKMQALIDEMDDTVDATPVTVDLTDEVSVAAAIEKTIEIYGKIDVLLHIAGGFAMPGPVHEGHLETWHKLMALNATALYITCGKVAASMLEKGVSGSITAIAARGGLKGGKNNAIYAASKSAALRIIESMSEELKDQGIRVNAISPSIIDTPQNRAAMGEANAAKWVTPDEIAETLLFLSSARASAITGANIEVYKRA